MVARVKSYKAGFVTSDSNISPDKTLKDILALSNRICLHAASFLTAQTA